MPTFITGIHLTWKDGRKKNETFLSVSSDGFTIWQDPKTKKSKLILTHPIRGRKLEFDIDEDEVGRIERLMQNKDYVADRR